MGGETWSQKRPTTREDPMGRGDRRHSPKKRRRKGRKKKKKRLRAQGKLSGEPVPQNPARGSSKPAQATALQARKPSPPDQKKAPEPTGEWRGTPGHSNWKCLKCGVRDNYSEEAKCYSCGNGKRPPVAQETPNRGPRRGW